MAMSSTPIDFWNFHRFQWMVNFAKGHEELSNKPQQLRLKVTICSIQLSSSGYQPQAKQDHAYCQSRQRRREHEQEGQSRNRHQEVKEESKISFRGPCCFFHCPMVMPYQSKEEDSLLWLILKCVSR